MKAINRVRPISSDALERYIIALSGYGSKYGLLVQLGITTGLRVSDLLRLKYGDFSDVKEALKINEQKTGKYRLIAITDEMRKQVMANRKVIEAKDSDYIFVGRDGVKPMHRTTAYRRLKHAGKQLGYEGIGTHSLRKTYAMRLYKESGGDVKYVSKCMNHKYTETTLHHYILSGVPLAALVKLCEEWG